MAQPEFIIPSSTPADAITQLATFREALMDNPERYHDELLKYRALGSAAIKGEGVELPSLLPSPHDKTSAKPTLSPSQVTQNHIRTIFEANLVRYIDFDDKTEELVDNDPDHSALQAQWRKAHLGSNFSKQRERSMVWQIQASRLSIFTREILLQRMANPANQNQLAE